MAVLAAPPRARFVDPTLYAPFSAFSCGDSTSYEREVNEIVAKLYVGQGVGIDVRVAEEATTGEFLGLCGVQARPLVLGPPHPPISDAAYICAIGVPKDCRGKYRLPDGTRIGDFLLADALAQIHLAWGGGSMPPVWALIDGANTASHNLFTDHGFGHIPAGPLGRYDISLDSRDPLMAG